MANAADYKFDFFNVTFPLEYVAHVEINRPEKLNAFKEIMWHNLSAIFKKLSQDPEVRVVILTGAGDRAFTAGLDIQAASQGNLTSPAVLDPARKANTLRRHILDFQACISSVEQCEKPVIALLHGIAYGLALDLSLACDVRHATRTTRFSIKEVDIGLAADIGTLSRLPHAGANASFVKEVALSGREFGGDEALARGVVSRVYASKEEGWEGVLGLAHVIAGKSPVAVVGTKEIVNFSRGRTVEDGLRYTAVWNAGYLQTRDVKDAMVAGLERKKAVFTKL